jgi:hypothetical protein
MQSASSTRSRITSKDIYRFASGDCHYLARAISQRSGWPIYCFVSDNTPALHAFVCMPDGRALDIEGVHTLEELTSKWENYYFWRELELVPLPFTFTSIRRVFGGPKCSHWTYRRAHEVAEILLQQHQ